MQELTYLDNATTSHPKPEAVYRTVDRLLRETAASPGRSSHRGAAETIRGIEAARAEIARFFGGDAPERVVFTLNATDALNMALKGCLREGDHVVTTALEHNSVARPLHRMERLGRISVTRVPASPAGYVDPDDLVRAIRRNTRLVAVNHGSNVLGTVQALESIGPRVRERGPLFLVDAAQTAGVLPIDAARSGVDLLAFTGHKGMLGPVGVGGLWLSERALPDPWREGGTGGDSDRPEQPEEMPTRLEAGTPNTAGIGGLLAGVRVLRAEGLEPVHAREVRLRRLLAERLAGEPRVRLYAAEAAAVLGILSANVEGYDPAEVGMILDGTFGIAVRTGLHCAPGAHRLLGTFPAGAVRFSFGFFNTEAQVEFAAGALAEIARGRVRAAAS